MAPRAAAGDSETHPRRRTGGQLPLRGDAPTARPPFSRSGQRVANASHPPASSRLPPPLHGHRAGAPYWQRSLPQAWARQANPDSPPPTPPAPGAPPMGGARPPQRFGPSPLHLLHPPPPPPPASPRPLLQVTAVAPLPAPCRRVSSSYIPPPSPLPAPRPFHWSAPPATRTTPPPSPPHHPKRSLRSRWRTINTAITPGQMRRQNRRHV